MSFKIGDMICLLRYVRQCMRVNVNLIINIDKFVNLYHNKTARRKRIVLQGGFYIFFLYKDVIYYIIYII